MINNGRRLSIQINYKAPPKSQPNAAAAAQFMALSPGMETTVDYNCSQLQLQEVPNYSALAELYNYEDDDDEELDRMIERLEKTVGYLETCNDLLKDALAIQSRYHL